MVVGMDYGVQHTGETVCSFDGGDVIECKECGFKHVIPLPLPEKLKEFYEQEFYQLEKVDYLKSSSEDVEWKNVEFERRFKIVEKQLPEVNRQRVLDIGCGPGDFLASGHSRGWQCLGIEPSAVAAEFASSKGLEVINAFFDRSLKEQLGNFEFIHMSEVLEHIPNPKELLSLAMDMLIPGGILCVSVPNDFSAIQKAAMASEVIDRWWVVPDHHLNYFDFNSLGKLLSDAGLHLHEKTTNFPMELFLLMGQNYTEDGVLGRQLHSMRKSFDLALAKSNPELLNKFYGALADAGMGRLAIHFAQKPLS